MVVAVSIAKGVNLPRWGLKRKLVVLLSSALARVNLPRWGLKLVAILWVACPLFV